MHILFVAVSFPSRQNPYRSPFIREQVRLLSEHRRIERITVLAPSAYAPGFVRRLYGAPNRRSVPEDYELVPGVCQVLFPKYLKAPGDILLGWTIRQWCRIVDRTVSSFAGTHPVSILHANAGSVTARAALYAGKRHGIPCVVTYQGSEVHAMLARRRKGWRLCRDAFRFADLNLPVSESLEVILRRHARPRGRCEVLRRGADQTRFYPPAERTRAPRVLFVGRIEPAKGVFDILSAWLSVQAACPDARLTLVGPDCSEGGVLRKAAALGIRRTISYAGVQPPERVADLMRDSRLFCLPSHAEGTPNSVMEALSCGLPVVGTRVGGIPEIVEHDETGLLVERSDIDGLGRALLSLLTDSTRCDRMSKAAAEYARQRLNARNTVARLVALYEEIQTTRHGAYSPERACGLTAAGPPETQPEIPAT